MEDQTIKALLYAFDECFDGEGKVGGIFLESDDPGLFFMLDALAVEEASSLIAGMSIANHVYHLLFALDVFIKRANGDKNVLNVDWSASWKEQPLNEAEWVRMKKELACLREEAASVARDYIAYQGGCDMHLRLVMGLLSHTVFHLGIIRVKFDELKGSGYMLAMRGG